MPITAVLFDAPPPELATESLHVGGITVLERQVRQVRRAGVVEVVVVGSEAYVPCANATNDLLVIDPGVVLDERIVRALIAVPASAVATWPAAIDGTERIDAASTAAGIGLYTAALVLTVTAGLGEWDLAATLRRAALAEGASRIDLATLPLEKGPVLFWACPDDAATSTSATTALLSRAGNVPHDAPGRWINAPVAAQLARLLLETAVTPAMVTLVVLALALAATAAFAAGWSWTGLVLALVVGAMDGVDRRLARVRLEPTAIYRRARPVIAVADYGWFAGAGVHFGMVLHSSGPIAVAALIIGFALADRIQDNVFRRATGTDLADAGPVERRLRLLGAARDSRVWTWLPFAIAGMYYVGFAVLAVYTTVTFFAAQRCVLVRLWTGISAANRCPTTAKSD